MTKQAKPIRLDRRLIYQCPWVSLYADRVQIPNGTIIEQYHVFEFERPAVGALVLNGVGDILLVHVYRYPTDSVNWEIPAGRMEKDENVEQAAAREVFEESGYQTYDYKLVYTFHPLNGISNETLHIIECCAGEKSGTFDNNEIAGIRWITRKEAVEMIRRNEIMDSFSLTALLFYLSGVKDLRQVSE